MGQTPTYAIPFPELTDTADVPRDMAALAARVDALFVAVNGGLKALTLRAAGNPVNLPGDGVFKPYAAQAIAKAGIYLAIGAADVYVSGGVPSGTAFLNGRITAAGAGVTASSDALLEYCVVGQRRPAITHAIVTVPDAGGGNAPASAAIVYELMTNGGLTASLSPGSFLTCVRVGTP